MCDHRKVWIHRHDCRCRELGCERCKLTVLVRCARHGRGTKILKKARNGFTDSK